MYKIFDDVDLNYFNNIENKILNKIPVSEKDINYFLTYVIYMVREKIIGDDIFFTNKCDLAQSMICHYFNSIGVTNYPNITLNSITDNIVGHSFVVACFNVCGINVNYLIDPTYIQFFKRENCTNDKFIFYNGYVIRTPDPGYYIKTEDISIINKFNYYGFGELTEYLAKVYGDSFYNTKIMVRDFDFKEMMGFVYINSFLKGNTKLSKSVLDLTSEGYLLDFSEVKKNRKLKIYSF